MHPIRRSLQQTLSSSFVRTIAALSVGLLVSVASGSAWAAGIKDGGAMRVVRRSH